MAEFMRNTDAFTWAMESDPRLRSTIVTVVLLDRSPVWDVIRERFDEISRTLPMFRQRVVPSPAKAPPRWEFVREFDLDFHLRRLGAPEPPNLEGVLEMARIAQMEAFDPARPMWQVTLIGGLEDGQAALLCKLHHALTDGVGGVQIAMKLFDLSESPGAKRLAPPEAPVPPRRAPLGGYRDSLRYNAALAGKVVTTTVKAASGLMFNGIRHPVATVGEVVATATSMYRMARPVNRPGSALMTRRRLIRRLAVLDVPMPQLRDAAHRAGGALNDAFVAGVTGGLRRYHEKHDSPVGDLHVTMPISVRGESDPIGGNRITLMRFDVPVGVADPATRIKETQKRARAVRDERAVPYTQLVAGILNLVPRWYIGSVLRHVDFVASDVPGVPVPVYLGGARVLKQYAFGPTIGAAVNVTLLTYVNTCAVGIDVDTAAIPDFEVFYECLVAGFDEVLALGR